MGSLKTPKQQWTPPPLRNDRFGLPPSPPSLLTGETKEEKARRYRQIKDLIVDLFASASRHLGRDEAKKLFVDVTKQQRRGRRPDSKKNQKSLELYDEVAKKRPMAGKKNLARLAANKEETDPRKRDNAERRIRRLNKQRQEDKEREEIDLKLRDSIPPSLLAQASRNLKG